MHYTVVLFHILKNTTYKGTLGTVTHIKINKSQYRGPIRILIRKLLLFLENITTLIK